MSAKKTICMLSAGAMLAAAVPAFADHDRSSGHRYRGYDRQVVVQQPVTVERRVERTVVHQRPVYQHQPMYSGYGHPAYRSYPVYSEPVYPQPYYSEPYYPAPAYGPAPYYVERRDNTAAILGGAAIGAAIGSQIGDRHSRPATTAIGAVLGAIIGSEF